METYAFIYPGTWIIHIQKLNELINGIHYKKDEQFRTTIQSLIKTKNVKTKNSFIIWSVFKNYYCLRAFLLFGPAPFFTVPLVLV